MQPTQLQFFTTVKEGALFCHNFQWFLPTVSTSSIHSLLASLALPEGSGGGVPMP